MSCYTKGRKTMNKQQQVQLHEACVNLTRAFNMVENAIGHASLWSAPRTARMSKLEKRLWIVVDDCYRAINQEEDKS